MSWSQAGFEAIARMVAERTGLGLQHSGSAEIERATRRAMQRAGVAEPAEFARSLAEGSAFWDQLIEELTIRETYFYRNPEHFELLRSHVLPALRKARGEEHVLRAWSAGCASGEEAYSLAMLLHQEQLLGSAQVYGSDLCEHALVRARAGRYREWSLRGLDPALASLYLREEGSEMVVREALRSKVSFSRVNLADPDGALPPTALGPMDLIFCRNVLIYFDPQSAARVERALYQALAPGGWLLTGPSDPVLGEHAPFEVVTTAHGLLYRKPEASELPVRPPSSARKAASPWWRMRAAEERAAPRIPAASSMSAPVPARQDDAPPAPATQQAALPEVKAAQDVRERWRSAGAPAGLHACEEALRTHVLHAELYYLRALLLMDLGCHRDAVPTLRRCLYLDRSSIMAQFTLATLLRRIGDEQGARTAYRNVLERGADGPQDAPVPFGDGVRVATLTEAAARALLELEERR